MKTIAIACSWLATGSFFTASAEMTSRVDRFSRDNQTAAFQKEVDELSAAGGGVLRIPAGEYIVSSLRIRSGVTLHLDRNAYLYGATNECEYVRYVNQGDTAYSVVYAEGATNVAVVGEGVIDGRGRLHNRHRDHKLYPGWDNLYFQDCKNVRVEGVTLRNASSWCCFFRGCDGVVARKVKIFNHCSWSNDGIDIESSNVLVEDCDIDSEDDSLVMKAREPWRVVENVVVRNCRLSCNAEHIKIGTESLGTFRKILVENCDVACRTPKCATGSYLRFPGVVSLQTALSAISLFVVDGGSLEDVTMRRIKVGEGIITPICIRHAARKPRRLPGEGFLRNVLIEDVKMSAPSASFVACSITGLPDRRPQDITLRNIELMFKGGGRAAAAAQKITEEHPARYPAPYYVFKSTFPAYAFYLRHADNIRFENVTLRVMDSEEARPPIVADDATYKLDEDCSIPVRIGNSAKGVPFWNGYASFFRYAPAFAFKPVTGAVRYRFTLTGKGGTVRFEADSLEAPLSPVWNGLANAQWTVLCEGLDADGTAIGKSGERTFVKTAPFTDGYAPAKRPYREAARMIYEYMTSLPAMTKLVESGVPDQTYQHNAYPSKTHAAHIEAMLDWSAFDPANREKAMRFARASGDYLLSQLEPANAPLAWWPPTYGRKPLDYDPSIDGGKNRRSMEGSDPKGAAKYRGQVMSLYPADVGIELIALSKATGDGKYLEAAKGIGETYLRIRRADGTWALKYWLATGKVECDNILVPTRPLVLFERLADATGDAKWRTAADDCFAWLEKGPLTDWNWDGQFEDIKPLPPYQDLTKHNAIEAMFQLLKRHGDVASSRAKAREILRWCEDQFVFWEAPCAPDEELTRPGDSGKHFSPGRWHYPSVYEQYSCYISIDASATKLISAYLAMYRAERNPLDLAKAKALANAITQVQEPSGRVPTFWSANSKDGWLADVRYDWLNCMATCAKVLVDVAKEDL